MGDKLKVLNSSLNFFSNKLHQQKKNILALLHTWTRMFHLHVSWIFRMRMLSYHHGFDEHHSRKSKVIVFQTVNFRSQGVSHFLILSHRVASCGGLV